MDVATLAVLIGLANGFLLLLKPIYRVHQRIDRNAEKLESLEKRQVVIESRFHDLIDTLKVE